MFGHRRPAASAASLLLLCTACFYTTAPEGWLPTPAVAQQQAYGGWIKVDYAEGNGSRTVEGELIAAAPDSLYVLTTDSLVSLATGTITSATLTAYDSRFGATMTWGILGAVSTLSHGWFLILSLPMWVIAGTTTSASASKGPRVQAVDGALLRPYARFPQGLPPGLDRGTLRRKATPGDGREGTSPDM
jgi:hypothetical protein